MYKNINIQFMLVQTKFLCRRNAIIYRNYKLENLRVRKPSIKIGVCGVG